LHCTNFISRQSSRCDFGKTAFVTLNVMNGVSVRMWKGVMPFSRNIWKCGYHDWKIW